MTKFEEARIIGARAEQIARGAQPCISVDNLTTGQLDPIYIATEELKQFKTPMIIKRPLPDGTYELWPVSDFKPKTDDNN